MEVDLEEIDDGLPEGFALLDAPGMQGRVVGQVQGMAVVYETAEGIQAGMSDTLGGRRPQRLLHGQSSSFLSLGFSLVRSGHLTFNSDDLCCYRTDFLIGSETLDKTTGRYAAAPCRSGFSRENRG